MLKMNTHMHRQQTSSNKTRLARERHSALHMHFLYDITREIYPSNRETISYLFLLCDDI